MKNKKWSLLLVVLFFLLTVLAPAHADPVSLEEIIANNKKIRVGDKLFSDFAASNVPFLLVVPRTFNPGIHGLSFRGAPNIPDGVTPLPGNISFTVTALDPIFRITAFSSAVGALATGTGTVRINDKVLALGSGNVLGENEILTTGLPNSETLPIVKTVPLSHGVQSLRFMRTVQLTGPLAGNQALNMSVAQTAIPEPSTVLLFGTGLAGLGLLRWKENRVG